MTLGNIIDEIKVSLLPDLLELSVPQGYSAADLLQSLKLSYDDPNERPIAAEINGSPRDLATILADGDMVGWLSFRDEAGRNIFWHSAAHLLAAAATELYPGTLCAIGPAIDQGFYYDFEFPVKVSDEDLDKILARMKELADDELPFCREEYPAGDLIDRYMANDDRYKAELASEHGVESPILSQYSLGVFTDLCRGPHLPNSSLLKHVALLSVAGAYWRGSEKNIMLTRIYGIAYPTEEQVQARLRVLEEIKKRDHRLIAKKLDLYTIREDAGAGLVFWHPRGARLLQLIEEFWYKAHQERDYEVVRTPHIARGKLWETSGHMDFYRENMYILTIEDEEYALKPMNCPGHLIIYQSHTRSYRDLPIKLCELGTVYRYERSGTLHGLLRVRGFTQDDGHIFCTPEQIEPELHKVCELVEFMMASFGYSDYVVELSVRDPETPDKYIGSEADWAMAESVLARVAKDRNYHIKRMPGEAVFYGPKIDFKLLDALGRPWQGPTVQFDFNLPNRFGVTYIGEDGAEHLCYIIHRALLGSLERFVAGLLENTGGALPLFVAPVQAVIIPVTLRDADILDYARKIKHELAINGVRVELDLDQEKLGKKIRNHEELRIPFMLVVGKKELEEGTVNVRERGEIEHGGMTVAEFLKRIR